MGWEKYILELALCKEDMVSFYYVNLWFSFILFTLGYQDHFYAFKWDFVYISELRCGKLNLYMLINANILEFCLDYLLIIELGKVLLDLLIVKKWTMG